jgi:hypothetical protein
VSANEPARCPLCDQPLGSPLVRLTTGGYAHVSCAERTAAAAWRWRRRAALGHALLAGLGLVGLCIVGGPRPTLLAITLAWVGLYALLHRRFVYYLQRDLRLALRRCCAPRSPK